MHEQYLRSERTVEETATPRCKGNRVIRSSAMSSRRGMTRVAEQHVLEGLGFQREGVLHEVGWRDGAWRDAVVYGLLRS